MLKLSQNCSYRFLNGNATVYTLCRRKFQNDTLIADVNVSNQLVFNPLRLGYYSEPVVDSKGCVKNALIGFATNALCSSWKRKIVTNFDRNSKDFHGNVLDTVPTMFDDSISILSYKLEDVKAVSDGIKLPLVIILNEKTESQSCEYEVFYYNARHKQLNF